MHLVEHVLHWPTGESSHARLSLSLFDRDCVQKIYKEFGVPRFYRGITINIIRMAPNTAIQFYSYELLKEASADLL